MEDETALVSQWAILPAPVRYDPELPPNAKLLFAEIAAKTNTLGYCWASNKFFCDRLHIKPDRIADLLHALEERGYILVDYDRARENHDKRRIYYTAAAFAIVPGIGENTDTRYRGKNRDRPGENTDTPTLYENQERKGGPEKPKYMALDVFKAICSVCGEDGDLLIAWMQYAEMRQRTRHPIGTVSTVERAAARIEKLSGGRRDYKLGLLHKATDSSWRGFYPLTPGDEGYEQQEANERRPERWD